MKEEWMRESWRKRGGWWLRSSIFIMTHVWIE
jgi:hypothetical protein